LVACDEAAAKEGVAEVIARAVDHGLLRPALELAVVVARTGVEARPPIQPPGPLRPLLHHAKWTGRTMATVARVLEADAEFRQRVAEAALRLDPVALGAPSRLWLTRPEGWEQDLAVAVRDSDEAADQRRLEKEERQARRQVIGLTEELERQRAELEAAGQRAAAAEGELVEQRRERREALFRIDELTAARAEAQAGEQRWRGAAETAERSETARAAALAEAEEELTELRNERTRMAERIAQLEADLVAARAERDSDGAATERMASTVAQAVADAASAAQALGAALGVAAQTLVDRGRTPPDGRAPGGSPAGPGSGSPAAERPAGSVAPRPAGAGSLAVRSPVGPSLSLVDRGLASGGGPNAGTRRPRVRRRPLPLPPAVFEDSLEAANHLVRSGVLLLVDGYNVSLFAWPELALPAQRHRMTTALAELAARSGASVQVVFDGDEQHAYPSVRGTPRTPVRTVFSTPGVDADEVIIDLVDDHPSERAVVVATNDRRVQEEVRRRGANVLTTPQLLGLLRRAGPRG
jgi:predicted RNA-binding protein with PIN domain